MVRPSLGSNPGAMNPQGDRPKHYRMFWRWVMGDGLPYRRRQICCVPGNEMNQHAPIAEQKTSGSEKRRYPRLRVLLGAVVTADKGINAYDGIIRNLSARGASVHAPMAMQTGDEIYLLDTRNHLGYFAAVRWTKSENAGVEFIRTYDLNTSVPDELSFLEKLLIEAKLRQVRALEKRGVDLEHAASTVGLSEGHLAQIDNHVNLATEYSILLDRLMPVVESGALSRKRIPTREDGWPKFSFFRRPNRL